VGEYSLATGRGQVGRELKTIEVPGGIEAARGSGPNASLGAAEISDCTDFPGRDGGNEGGGVGRKA